MGNMGGALIQLVTGAVLAAGLGFMPLFIFAAASYLVALAWLHWLLPHIQRVEKAETIAA
jgi:ACS family hexuronate transporter-like MFS transporter